MNDLESFITLTFIPRLGATRIRQLVDYFGSAQAAIKAPTAQIGALPGFERLACDWQQWRATTTCQQEISLAEKQGIQIIPFTHPEFPKALLATPDHPALLYVRGTLKPQDKRSIAIVGTRHASIYGLEMAVTISQTLAANGFTVISGLARGIDTAAHKGALAAGRTIAVIGSGLNRVYPTENQMLADEICTKGALISEFPLNTPPDRQNFPQRNRIVSGLTLATLLIEAPLKSGAMITMEKSHQYKRKLFALPGRADNDNFRGNHLLIKSGKAHLVENAEDIMQHYDALFSPATLAANGSPYVSLDQEESGLLAKMANAEVSIDELASLVALPVQQVQRILMSLLLKKVIKEYPGKIYKKIAAVNTLNSHNRTQA